MKPRSGWFRARLLAIVGGLGLLLASCASNAPQDTLKPAGPVARRIDDLFIPVFWVAVVVFVVVQGALIYAMIRFRRSRMGEDHVPEQVHGNTRMEIGWTIAPALILAVVAVPTVTTIIDLARSDPDAVQVTVYGAQWWWEYEYPGEDVVTANELHIPVGRPVQLTMTSRDVIHSYWVPKLGGKKDVVPGRWHTLTIQADEPGEFYGQCAEFCGASHANMRLRVIAQTTEDYEAWLEANRSEAVEPAAGTAAAAGRELIEARGCTGCHVIQGVSSADQLSALRDRLIVAPGDGLPFAPDLTHFASRGTFAGSLFDTNPVELARWLRDPPGRKDGSLMPNMNLNEDEIRSLVAYLLSLR